MQTVKWGCLNGPIIALCEISMLRYLDMHAGCCMTALRLVTTVLGSNSGDCGTSRGTHNKERRSTSDLYSHQASVPINDKGKFKSVGILN